MPSRQGFEELKLQLTKFMINLEQASGLPIELGDDYHLKFMLPLKEVVPSIRTFEEMRPLYQKQDTTAVVNEMYYMYRGIGLPQDQDLIKQTNVSYDITVIPACLIGREYNKTLGHYHSTNSKGMVYPEVYEVLYGKALFLIQKMDNSLENLISVLAIPASAGDKVIYPPGYGHAMINVGVDTLVTANWVSRDYGAKYEPIINRHGMAYYVVSEGTGQYSFIPNPNYANAPGVRILNTNFMKKFPIAGSEPMYLIGTRHSESLELLNYPEKYAVELSSITS